MGTSEQTLSDAGIEAIVVPKADRKSDSDAVRDDFGRASAWRLRAFQLQDRLRGFLFVGATNRARLNLQPNIVIRNGALLSMSRKREHERALFTAFLDLAPEFAGERLDVWQQPEDESDFPDIIARSITGRKIGVELGE